MLRWFLKQQKRYSPSIRYERKCLEVGMYKYTNRRPGIEKDSFDAAARDGLPNGPSANWFDLPDDLVPIKQSGGRADT